MAVELTSLESPRSTDGLNNELNIILGALGDREEEIASEDCVLETNLKCRLNISGFALIITTVVLGALFFPACFALYFELHAAEETVYVFGIPQIPTLSLTGAFWPSSAIFTLFMHIYAGLSFLIFSMITEIYSARIAQSSSLSKKQKRSLTIINRVLYYLGVVFSLFLVLTGTILISRAEIAHAIVAIIMFIAGVLHICIFTWTLGLLGHEGADGEETETNEGKNTNFPQILRKYVGLRWWFTAFLLAVPFNVIALLVGFAVGMTCGKTSEKCRALGVQMVVVVEYTTAIALFLYVVGFLYVPEMGTIAVRLGHERAKEEQRGVGGRQAS